MKNKVSVKSDANLLPKSFITPSHVSHCWVCQTTIDYTLYSLYFIFWRAKNKIKEIHFPKWKQTMPNWSGGDKRPTLNLQDVWMFPCRYGSELIRGLGYAKHLMNIKRSLDFHKRVFSKSSRHIRITLNLIYIVNIIKIYIIITAVGVFPPIIQHILFLSGFQNLRLVHRRTNDPKSFKNKIVELTSQIK